jgi:hypothetical protein
MSVKKKPSQAQRDADDIANLLMLGSVLISTNRGGAMIVARGLSLITRLARENKRLRAAIAKEKEEG